MHVVAHALQHCRFADESVDCSRLFIFCRHILSILYMWPGMWALVGQMRSVRTVSAEHGCHCSC